MDVDPPVVLPFVLDFADTYSANFSGRVQVRSTTGLQIDTFDFKKADTAFSSRRLHRHRAHKLGLRIEFRFAYPTTTHAVAFRDERLQSYAYGFLVDAIRHVEIQATLLGGDVASRDAILQNRSQQMHCGVHSHMSITALPVQGNVDLFANGRLRHSSVNNVPDRAILSVSCIDNRSATVTPRKYAAVARLTATQRIKNGPIKYDRSFIGRDHNCIALPEI